MNELQSTDPRQIGRYRIAGRLGGGGMGQVYLGQSPSGRLVAVKIVRPELAEDPGFRRRFAHEVAAARRVNGFFTAAVVDADPDSAMPWLATAYIPGLPLDEAVAAHGPWPVESVRALGAGLAEALEAIHAADLVHRDLKPSNVLIAPDGPRVVDFGISVAAEATALTRTGMVIGTPGYMAPEQLAGRPVTPATDVFALGAVLTYAATGTGPFGTGSAQALNFRIAYEEPDISQLPPGLAIIERCLAKDPDRRPSVTALIEDLAPVRSESHPTAGTALLTAAWPPAPLTRALHSTVAVPAATAPLPTEPAATAPLPAEPAATAPLPTESPSAPSTAPLPTPSLPTPSADRPEPLAVPAPGTGATAPARPAAPAAGARPAGPARPTTPFWTAVVALPLALALPPGNRSGFASSALANMAHGSLPWVVASALGVGSCVLALFFARRSRADSVPRSVPRWPRYLHGFSAALNAVLLIVILSRTRLQFDLYGPGAYAYILGCLMLLQGLVRFPR
ncbi:protein kinase [Kitasatospora sp. NBC_01560]|uniref:serine/threonine-protein kinase n=1 Tax=Kitasatospora sp. NBC_01560 TaxID=2975965 RepID=UPI00386622D1